jgi:hypothetical protein
MPQRDDAGGARPLVAVLRGGKDDPGAVRRPLRFEIVAAVAELPAEACLLHELRTGEEVARRARVAERLHEQRGARFIQPAIPKTDRRAVVDARLVLTRLALLCELPVVRVRCSSRKYLTDEQDRLAVRPPLRRARAGCHARHALRLAGTGDVHHVDLVLVVVLAARGEGKLPAVRAPGHIALAALRVREAARRGAAVRGHEPQITPLVLLLVRRLGDRKCDPLSVRTHRRGAGALHPPHVLVRDRVLRGLCDGRGGHEHCEEEKAHEDSLFVQSSDPSVPSISRRTSGIGGPP